jgi:hypothetical protein
LTEQAKGYIAQATTKAEETVEQAQSSFQKGMEQAKAKVKSVEKKIDQNGVITK